MDNLASHSCYELCKLVAKHSNIKCPSDKELDRVGKRRQWLQSEDKRIIFHFTPFHGSWLNVVEIWFGILNQKCFKESFNSPDSIYNAIYDFANLWNTLLAHPFKWNYDGTGLHQKVVDRFSKIIENNTVKMNIKFMTKQFLLMQNLMKTYQEKVELASWIKLHQIINTNIEQLNTIISKDGVEKRMKKAQLALINLFDALTVIVNGLHKNAA